MGISFIIAQILALIGAISNMAAMQINKKKTILFCYVIANFAYGTNYLLLGGISGAIICIVEGFETLINGIIEDKGKKVPIWLIGLYIIIALGIGIFTYISLIDLLAIIGGILYVLLITVKKESDIRKLTFILMILWIIYDIIYRSYVAAINDTFILISTMIGIYRFDIKRSKK